MQLKSVEIIGFKSFAYKTKINFQNGLTEIVGPNGSGKSNVTEAIRWVLGEQSVKSLRSSKMSDVIFAGSNHHQALNRASVTLIFNDENHIIDESRSEIRVSRKLFRSGESYYYINDKESRLKDINNLFINAGINNNSFPIISQGQVNRIFQSNPNERRFIVEDAAGISKYKKQKETATKKLTDVNNNLLRIKDIIYELKTQNDSLAKQSNDATKYLDLKKQYRRLDLSKIIIEINQYNQKEYLINPKIQKISKQNTDIDNKVKEKRHKYASDNDKLDQLSVKQNKLHNDLLGFSNQLEKLNSNQKLNQQQLNFDQDNWKTLNKSQNKLKQDLKQLNQQKHSLDKSVENYRKNVTQLNDQIKQNENKGLNQEINNINNQLDRLRNQYIDLMQKSSDLTNQIENNQKEQLRFKSQLKSKKNNLAEYQKRLDNVNDDYQNINKLIQKNNNDKKEYQSIIHDNKDEYNKLTDKLKDQNNQYNKLWHLVQSKKIKYNNLNQSNHNYTNFYYGNRNLLSNNKINGIIGAVSEFINVPEQYLKAIETALGNRVQQIIVENDHVANNAIKYLNDNNLGRVTLLPLNGISNRKIPYHVIDDIKNIEGYVGIGSNLIQIPDALSSIKKHLLGNIIIVNTLENATKISQKINHRYRIVTLNGEIINAGGSITGGKNKKTKLGILSQKQLLNDTKEELKRNDKLLSNYSKTIAQLKAQLSTNQNQINHYQMSLSDSQQKDSFYHEKLEYYYNILMQNRRNIKTINLSIDNLKAGTNQSKNEDIESQLNLVKNDIKNNRELVTNKQNLISKYQLRKESNNNNFQRLNQDLAITQTKLDNYKRDISQLISNINNKNNQINTNDTKIESLSREISNLKLRVNNQDTIEKTKSQVQAIEEKINSNNLIINQYKNSISEDNQLIEKYRDEQFSINEHLKDLNQQKENIKNKLSQYQNRLNNKYYQNEIYEIQNEKTKLTIKDIEQQLTEINQELNKLGTVNVNSIEEYKDVHNRYVFLNKQFDDLNNSKQHLTKTMEQIDKIVKRKFNSTFNAINKYFKKIFVNIFQGGKAELTLTNPDSLLTTGVDIKAQPPGKKYRQMSLLSGGEQSLIAIVLLFAILNVKPAPFCILDEVDSALDSDNINRFAQYMSKLKSHSQFILITHRKETMMYADNLYGITMQDSGISKMISINLTKIE